MLSKEDFLTHFLGQPFHYNEAGFPQCKKCEKVWFWRNDNGNYHLNKCGCVAEWNERYDNAEKLFNFAATFFKWYFIAAGVFFMVVTIGKNV